MATSLLAPADATTGGETDLRAEAKALTELHRQRLGPNYATRIDHKRHLVYVSALVLLAVAPLCRTTCGGDMDRKSRF